MLVLNQHGSNLKFHKPRLSVNCI